MAKNGRVHPVPYDSFKYKAHLNRLDAWEEQRAKRVSKPAWKDRIPFSGTRKDGKPIGKPVQVRKKRDRQI